MAVSISVKGADTRYDMLIALVAPLFKAGVIFLMAARDAKSSALDVKRQLLTYDLDFPRHTPHALVVLYRFHRTLV